MENPYRYSAMDKTLEMIHNEYVALPQEEKKRNTEILLALLNEIIEACKSNELFCNLYRAPYFGGSYYEGLKIKRPDEYDIHIKLCFPAVDNCQMISSYKSGYVHLQFSRTRNNSRKLWNSRLGIRRPYYGMNGLHVLINESDFLDSKKVMLWMHEILSKWVGGRRRRKARVVWKDTAFGTLQIKLQRHGPAFTFRVTNFEDIFFNFDFVPCFLFGKDQWPEGFRQYHEEPEKCEFYVIPKSPNNIRGGTAYLRTSFQEQDRHILYSKEKLKPALRLIKKLRDKLKIENAIVSFFIKNLFLWEVLTRRVEFWNLPLSYIFMKMLEKLQKSIKYGEIRYFWHHKFNLIGHIDNETLYDISETLRHIIIDIKNNPDDQYLIAKYLLSRSELKRFRSMVSIQEQI
ncbi:uncharacterized protein LOC108913593 [Anoplophora glabripennis]|uniref:uncharacterized protein LOC108913593 n=1 Tax=Anoplophora glabripennis TaxID=217634 RepID=UPI000873EC1E|nr:uncharacterized protein LOC108913593 [Anoplophora glabripennis]